MLSTILFQFHLVCQKFRFFATGLLLVASCLSILTTELLAGEKLLYALRHESLQRYPDVVSTRIYSIGPDLGESKLVFSDEKTEIMLLPRRGMPGHPGEVLVSSKNRVFSHAVEKRLNPGRWYARKASIYELFVDGSNRFNKIFDVLGEQSLSEAFVNPEGTKIGYINYLDQKTFIFLHETDGGRLLHKIDVSKIFLDCFVSSIGWLPNGDRIFLTLDAGDVHVTSEESYKQRGTYIISGTGTNIAKLPEEFTLLPLKRDEWRFVDGPPQCLGGLPGGSYLLSDIIARKGPKGNEARFILYTVDPSTNSRTTIPLNISKGPRWFKVSHTAKQIAFTEKIYSKDGSYTWIENLWVKNLTSKGENRIFTLDNVPFKGFHFGLIGWIQE